jgi:hypothetical protein
MFKNLIGGEWVASARVSRNNDLPTATVQTAYTQS